MFSLLDELNYYSTSSFIFSNIVLTACVSVLSNTPDEISDLFF
jgi:hypothetical protein